AGRHLVGRQVLQPDLAAGDGRAGQGRQGRQHRPGPAAAGLLRAERRAEQEQQAGAAHRDALEDAHRTRLEPLGVLQVEGEAHGAGAAEETERRKDAEAEWGHGGRVWSAVIGGAMDRSVAAAVPGRNARRSAAFASLEGGERSLAPWRGLAAASAMYDARPKGDTPCIGWRRQQE